MIEEEVQLNDLKGPVCELCQNSNETLCLM